MRVSGPGGIGAECAVLAAEFVQSVAAANTVPYLAAPVSCKRKLGPGARNAHLQGASYPAADVGTGTTDGSSLTPQIKSQNMNGNSPK